MAFAFSVTPTAGVGTISIGKNGATVTGVGTNFQSPSLNGQIILVNGFNSRVTAVASATSMTINRVPSYEITGEAFSFVAGTASINQSGADTDPSGLSALLGVNTYRVGIQAVYDLGVLRLALTGAAAVFSYDANRHCIVWSNQVVETELTIGAGRTLTITGARTDGTFTAPFYPRALAFPRFLPADSSYIPGRRSIVNNGTLNFSGIWVDGNQVSEINSVANITDVKWSSTDQQSNYRMNSGSITVNGMDLYNVALTLIQSAAALNGMRFYNSGYTPVSLPSVAPSNPRIYTDWNFLGALPLMNNFSGNANYVEFRNFGDWDGFRLATNSAVNMAARFVKNVSVNVTNSLGVGITDAIVYRLDTNNGNRATYTADEHFIQSTVSGAATGRILALIGRLPTGAANNSTQYTAFMDCRNAANDQTGNDVLRYVSYDHLLANRNVNTKGIGTLTSEQTLFNDTSVTLSRTNAIAKLASSFTVDPVTKIVTVTANSSFDDVYDALKAYKATANAVNLATPTLDSLIVTPNGTTSEAFTGWSLVVNNGVTLSSGIKFDKVKFNTITLTGTAQITGIYQDSTGVSTILELRGVTAGSSIYIGDNATGITKLFQSNTSSDTYRAYFSPTETSAQLVARELYGTQRDSEVIPLTGGLIWYQFVDIPDTKLTQTDKATVAAYTSLDNTEKRYDYTAYFRLSEQGIKLGQIVTAEGTSLTSTYSTVVKQTAIALYNIVGNVITIKAASYDGTSKYLKEIVTGGGTVTAFAAEVITVKIEDANGDSSCTIAGTANSLIDVWKITNATAVNDFATGTKLASDIGNGQYRFVHVTGYKLVFNNKDNGIYRYCSMSKGDYTAGWYLYDNPNGGLTTEEKTTLDSIYTKSTIIQNGVVTVDGKVDALTTDVAAIPADVWAESVRTLTSAGAAGATLAEIEGSLILAKEATSAAIKAKTDRLEFNAQNHIAANVHQLQAGAITSIQNGLSLEATSQDILTAVNNIDVDFTPVLAAVATKPTLTEIEDSTVLAKESTVTSKLDASAYTAPDNASLLSVKATVENLPNLSAIESSTILAKEVTLELKLDASSYTAPDNSSIASIKGTVEALPALSAIESSTIMAKEATLKGVKSAVDALQ
jgi:hypothetical protein